MTRRKVPDALLVSIVGLTAALMSAGCDREPTFEVAEAAALIQAQFPESQVEVSSSRVEPDGSAVAVTQLEEQNMSFIFQPGDDGWRIEAVDFDGSFYYLEDLEQIQATMVVMMELASALEQYRAANSTYPAGEDETSLGALTPDFVAADGQFNDAWAQSLSYESDGADYTLISRGPDQDAGSRDDIVLHSGEFVGAGR